MNAWDEPRCSTCGLAVGDDYDSGDEHMCPPGFLDEVRSA